MFVCLFVCCCVVVVVLLFCFLFPIAVIQHLQSITIKKKLKMKRRLQTRKTPLFSHTQNTEISSCKHKLFFFSERQLFSGACTRGHTYTSILYIFFSSSVFRCNCCCVILRLVIFSRSSRDPGVLKTDSSMHTMYTKLIFLKIYIGNHSDF